MLGRTRSMHTRAILFVAALLTLLGTAAWRGGTPAPAATTQPLQDVVTGQASCETYLLPIATGAGSGWAPADVTQACQDLIAAQAKLSVDLDTLAVCAGKLLNSGTTAEQQIVNSCVAQYTPCTNSSMSPGMNRLMDRLGALPVVECGPAPAASASAPCQWWDVATTWTMSSYGGNAGPNYKNVTLTLDHGGDPSNANRVLPAGAYQWLSGTATPEVGSSLAEALAPLMATGSVGVKNAYTYHDTSTGTSNSAGNETLHMELPWDPFLGTVTTDAGGGLVFHSFDGRVSQSGLQDPNDQWSAYGNASCQSTGGDPGGFVGGVRPTGPIQGSTGTPSSIGSLAALPGGGSTTGTGGSTAAAPASAPGCAQWNVSGSWQVQQKNNYAPTFSLQQSGQAVTGTLSFTDSDRDRAGLSVNTYTATGSVTGSTFDVTVTGPNSKAGKPIKSEYTATVSSGAMSNGTIKDLTSGTSFSWSASGRAICASAS
jgi:hypothetical protein